MMKDETHKSALSVNKGVEQPQSVNTGSLKSFRKKRTKTLSPSEYKNGIVDGNITILSRAITLVESSRPDHRDLAMELVEECLPLSGNSVRIGITGVPGVGKSSFIERFGHILIEGGSRLAVLAVDPSSERSRGSILGDKTRMEELSANPAAFIRPSPSGGSLGGVAKKTRESIILCEAAGFDTIIVETVGVGQSETAVKHMVDFFLLLMLAGAGDELQGIKRGIMEMADTIAITKSDGTNMVKADLARTQYHEALRLFPPTESGWVPGVETCSSITGDGLRKIDEILKAYFEFTAGSEYFQRNRREQSIYWMNESIDNQLREGFYSDSAVSHELEIISREVLAGRTSSFTAARKLIAKYLNEGGKGLKGTE